MWFADVGLVLAWVLLAVWVGATGLVTVAGMQAQPVRHTLPVVAGTGIATVLFLGQAGLVDTVADGVGPGPLDRSVWSWFVEHRSGTATAVMTDVSLAGGTVGMTMLGALGAGLLWWRRHRAEAVTVVVAAVGAAVLTTGFKDLYGRARPPVADRLAVESGASLPSGHALGSVVVLGILAAAAVLVLRRTGARLAVVAVAGALTVLVGVSRLYLGVHWATDVATGWLLGGTWLAVCVTVLVRHRWRGRGIAGAGPDRGTTPLGHAAAAVSAPRSDAPGCA